MKYLHYIFALVAVLLLAIHHISDAQSNFLIFTALFFLVLTVLTPIVLNMISNRK